jgi:hypothetical protein
MLEMCMYAENSKKGALRDFSSVLQFRIAHASKQQKEKVHSVREWLKK